MGNLTVAKLNRLTEAGRHPDGDGLYLFIRSSGSRSWVLRTVVHGRRVDIGIGGYPEIGLADAREKASEMRKAARAGRDPLAARRKEVLTVEEAARAYYETLKPTFTSKRHADQWIASLDNDLFPKLGKRSMPTVTNADILRVLTPIWTEKPVAAKKLKQRLNSFFDWAYHAGHYEGVNPVTSIERALPKASKDVEHLAAMDWRELPAFYKTIEQAILKFLILSCVRSTECREAKWDEFDFENFVWTIPGERMKMGKEHRVPLTPEMVAVLEGQRPFKSEFVFPSLRKRGTAPVAPNFILRIVEGKPFTVHGFRSTFRDWASEYAHANERVAEAVLAHASGDRTERAYARSDLFDRRRKLMESWCGYATGNTANNVVPLRAEA
jgi:integrase